MSFHTSRTPPAARTGEASGGEVGQANAQRQAAILSAVAFAAERFLRTSDWRTCIHEVLAKLGSATGVSRIYIFENHRDDDGELCASHTYEWVGKGIEPQISSSELQGMSYESEGLRPLRDTVLHGDALVGLIREMPEAARSVLEPQNIVSIAIVPITTRDTFLGFLGFDDCHYERRWSEVEIDALKAAAGILGAAVQRTADEAHLRQKEEQLRQAQKMEAVGNLAGGIAHDFNNVLQIIWLSCEHLKGRLSEDSPLCFDVKTIGDAVQRARALPNQLLAFARQQVVQPQVLDLDESVRETVGMVRRVIGEDVLLDVHTEASPTLVNADSVQLQQAVMNLILNAREAMPDGGNICIRMGRLTLETDRVSIHARVPAGEYAVLTVEDEGTGMEEQTLQRIFEPFYTTKPRGHGIGLATVYGIVRQNSAYIEVESTLGKGSCFRIFFPLIAEHHEQGKLGDRPNADPGGHESVLVVEDEKPLRNVLNEILTGLGYNVIVAPDGPTALSLPERHIDLLLTDVVMPMMDGLTLASKLREKYPTIKVSFMSGHAFDALERRGINPSTLKLLRKPFSASELAHHLRKVLDG